MREYRLERPLRRPSVVNVAERRGLPRERAAALRHLPTSVVLTTRDQLVGRWRQRALAEAVGDNRLRPLLQRATPQAWGNSPSQSP